MGLARKPGFGLSDGQLDGYLLGLTLVTPLVVLWIDAEVEQELKGGIEVVVGIERTEVESVTDECGDSLLGWIEYGIPRALGSARQAVHTGDMWSENHLVAVPGCQTEGELAILCSPANKVFVEADGGTAVETEVKREEAHPLVVAAVGKALLLFPLACDDVAIRARTAYNAAGGSVMGSEMQLDKIDGDVYVTVEEDEEVAAGKADSVITCRGGAKASVTLPGVVDVESGG